MRELLRYVLLPALVGGLVGLGVMLATKPGAPAPKPGYAQAVKRAAPAVVNIYSSKLLTPPICQLPRFKEWCDRFTGGEQNHMQSSLGSGVIVREDGYILTNNHVIAGADEILVSFNNGQATTATVIGSDPETDLAVIKVEARGLRPIDIGESAAVEVGDVALAIGNPFGIGQTVSSGIISAKGRTGISPSPYDDFIQTDAAINPGNSGGALIDAAGHLIGVNTLIFSRSGGSEGIGFAIPAQLAMSVLNEIVETGRVTRGWLGVELASTPAPGMAVGLEVTRVLARGPADQAGLRTGDLIVAINEQPAVSSSVVSRLIAHAAPGSDIQLDILRGEEAITVTARSGERPVPN
ncbi:MAG: 2-alkenal reductase [Gammaproteobacteria bacterium]|nr:2-alkenal reductase [Gammaproteobacteria bacterium]|tara:strand:+ start:287 stop:1342 length:1056 start_codon:yes stop_codon:yes gene_type:complete